MCPWRPIHRSVPAETKLLLSTRWTKEVAGVAIQSLQGRMRRQGPGRGVGEVAFLGSGPEPGCGVRGSEESLTSPGCRRQGAGQRTLFSEGHPGGRVGHRWVAGGDAELRWAMGHWRCLWASVEPPSRQQLHALPPCHLGVLSAGRAPGPDKGSSRTQAQEALPREWGTSQHG